MKDGFLKESLIKLYAPIRRIGLKNRDFSIIANNCWGGIISRNYHLPYNSPTCGTYFFADDYIRFISDLKHYLACEMQPLAAEDSKHKDIICERHGEDVVLGKLDDVEVVLLHYPTFEEAKSKWERRVKRINFDNLLVKFSDMNEFRKEHFDAFVLLPYKNKVFFTANPDYASEITYVLPDSDNLGYLADDIKSSFKHVDPKLILNSMDK